ncbi:serine hydrolase [Pseudidiomarina sp. 1APP75-32.1]|uniref:Serine hydrolase n=2 Tax=Pseudidiomarina terrestris TaxID=2820060 RepID=A0AAW7QXH6_9GAMM|nr:serine hydrolase [Pseudidiomarina sp. 1APP75-32.1]MDN7129136.1 serine hydrolase [Pseudidiomarina sp. 1APR75-15]
MMLLLASVFALQLNFDRAEIPTVETRVARTEAGQFYPLEKGFQGDKPFGFALQPGAELSFVLREFNANCLHNGRIHLSTEQQQQLLDASATIQLSATYALTEQTCAYESFDWQGEVQVQATPLQDDLPVTPAVTPLRDAPWQPQPQQQQPTVYGWAQTDADGKLIAHYSSQPHIAVPAYSLSKTFIAAAAALLIERHSVTEILALSIASLIPECEQASWQRTTLRDALNMRTGHYHQTTASADESAEAMINDFFLVTSHAEKIRHACSYPAQQSASPAPFVYQSSATYLLATALQTGLQQNRFGELEGLHSDRRLDQLLYDNLWDPLQLSPLAYSIDSTKDARAQIWGGYGLSLLPGDLVALARFVQHDPMELGFAEILARPDLATPVPGNESLRYRASIWFWQDPASEQWYPFLSGYGGIIVVFLDSRHLYYLVSDQHDHRFADVIRDFQRWQTELAP